jgi:ElaA protein
MSIAIKHYHDLTKEELYGLLQLRTAVFVVEQNCPYQECDGLDQEAFHILLSLNEKLIGTARIIPKKAEVKLGRIVVAETHRGQQLGYKLVEFCLKFCKLNFSGQKISMSAQLHLVPFYNSLGFKEQGKSYLEDDIPHIYMELI